MKRKVEFFRHNISLRDKKECLKILGSIFLTTGNLVKQFEEKFANYVKAKYCVGLTSCTDALFLALKYLGIGPGDEVITTILTFAATSNAIEYCGAKPIFIDVEPNTGNINADLIEKAITSKTKAIIVVHLYGLMCDMKKIHKIARKYGIKIIEDSAHCIGGERDGILPGQLSDFACFSFHAIKTITSGEGGAITTNNKKAYEWLIKARLHGMSKNAADRYTKHYEHNDMEFLGYKCNMTNISAALLLNQIDRISTYLKKRERIANIYNQSFSKNKAITLPQTVTNAIHARFLYTIWVDSKKRDAIIKEIQNKGIGVSVHFFPLHFLTYYRKKYGYKRGDFKIAEKIGDSTISLPFYPKLTKENIRYITKTINSIVN